MSFTLPDLPYDHSALEPHIDSTTMEIHHKRHHNLYITNLNNPSRLEFSIALFRLVI